MTAGEHSDRDYGRDYHRHSPYHPDAEGYSGWDGELPPVAPGGAAAGYRPAYPAPGNPAGYPPNGDYPANSGYPPSRNNPASGYPAAGYPAAGGAPTASGYPVNGGYPATGAQPGAGYPINGAQPGAGGYPINGVAPGAAGYPGNGAYPGAGGYPANGQYPAGEGYPGGQPPAGGYHPGYPPDDGYPTPPPGYRRAEFRAVEPDPYPPPVEPGYPAGYSSYPARPGYPAGVDEGYPTSRFAPVDQAMREAGARSDYPAADAFTGSHRVVDPIARRRPAEGRPANRPPTDQQRKPKKRGLPLWQELPLLLVIALCLAILVRTFLLQAFYIPSGSMEDTLIAGDRVLVNKVVYNFREPARGEVVVFQGTDAWAPLGSDDEDIGTFSRVGRALGDLVGVSRPGATDYIKRVVGLPGDTVSCCDVEGRVFVNGQPLNEGYVLRDSPLDDVPLGDCRGRRFDEVVVQPGHMFVMGDHRQVSQDSRCQGQVPLDNVIGRAFIIVWPNDRWSGLSQPDTFTAVPPASSNTAGAAGGRSSDGVVEQSGAMVAGARLTDSAPTGPAVPALIGFGVPMLLSHRVTFRGDSGCFRLLGRLLGRRLAA